MKKIIVAALAAMAFAAPAKAMTTVKQCMNLKEGNPVKMFCLGVVEGILLADMESGKICMPQNHNTSDVYTLIEIGANVEPRIQPWQWSVAVQFIMTKLDTYRCQ